MIGLQSETNPQRPAGRNGVALQLMPRIRYEVVRQAGDIPSGRFEMLPKFQHAGPRLPEEAREYAEAIYMA